MISGKRQRLASNSSVHSTASSPAADKALRVNLKKMDASSLQAAMSGVSSGDEAATSNGGGPPKRKTRKTSARGSTTQQSPLSPGRKRGSELEKLLEAGSSSFHFETARQTANRLGVLHVDTKDDEEDSDSSEEEAEAEPEPPKKKVVSKPAPKSVKAKTSWSKSQRLLKKVSPRPPTPKGGRKGRRPAAAAAAKAETDEAESADSESEEDLVSVLQFHTFFFVLKNKIFLIVLAAVSQIFSYNFEIILALF